MNQDIEFGKREVVQETETGALGVVTAYFKNEPVTIKETVRIDTVTSQRDVLKDIVTCLEDLKQPSSNLIIEIQKDSNNQPRLIQRSYTIIKLKKRR